MRSLLVAAALLLGGCILEEVSLEGKSCPCATGYICDDEINVCVRMLERRDSGVPAPDAGQDAGVDAGSPDAAPIPECARDSECPATEICVDAACEAGCAVTGCGADEICDSSGHCFSSTAICTAASDCNPPHQICAGGRCQPGCAVGAGSCIENRICDPSSGYCEAAPRCSAEVGCPDRQFSCFDGVCLRSCDAPGAAPCIGALPLGAACTADDTCASGFCSGTVCTTPCGRTADCPLGFSCLTSSSGYRVCTPERILEASFETPSGEACTNPDDVCQSAICDSTALTCTERCTRNLDCAAYGTGCIVRDTATAQECADGPGTRAAREICAANADCASGICDKYRSLCADPCCTDTDCPAEQNCLAYDFTNQIVLTICQLHTNTTSIAIGMTCTGNADCASGLCAPASPLELEGPKLCSVRCCTHADCRALAGGYCHPIPGVLGTQAPTCFSR